MNVQSPDEMEFLEENARELEQYPGEWLLIQGRELLIHSSNFHDIKAVIRERKIDCPFVYYVPTDEESNWIPI